MEGGTAIRNVALVLKTVFLRRCTMYIIAYVSVVVVQN